ncbi:hypothetical protein BH11PSE2_BH11PSE2_21600 [soil metagenome]
MVNSTAAGLIAATLALTPAAEARAETLTLVCSGSATPADGQPGQVNFEIVIDFDKSNAVVRGRSRKVKRVTDDEILIGNTVALGLIADSLTVSRRTGAYREWFSNGYQGSGTCKKVEATERLF